MCTNMASLVYVHGYRGPEEDVGSLASSSFLETGSLTEPELGMWPSGPSVSASQHLVTVVQVASLAFHEPALDLNSGPHVCLACALTSVPVLCVS